MTRTRLLRTATLLPLVLAALAPVAASAAGHDGGPTGAFTYSRDPAVVAEQRAAKHVVERYQAALNAGDFATIRTLFAPGAVAEWNTKRTMIGADEMAPAYAALFKSTKFSTDFQYDAVDIHGDIAIVRTHHPVGQAEVSKQTGKRTLDFNREIFVLKRTGADWKIILYTFSSQPRQGEQ